MRETVLSGYHWAELNCWALVMFLAVFVGSVAWVYRKSGKKFYGYMEQLPLKDESTHD